MNFAELEKVFYPYLDSFSMEQLDVTSVLLAVCGLVCCFFGYRTAKLAVDVVGFIVLGLFAMLIAGYFTEGNLLYMGGSLVVGGMIGGILAHFVYRLGIAVFGVVLCGLVAWNMAEPAFTAYMDWGIVGLAGIAGGLAAYLMNRFTVSLMTAALGAKFAVEGIFLLLESTKITVAVPRAGGTLSEMAPEVLSWAGLTVVGFMFQLLLGGRKKTSGQ